MKESIVMYHDGACRYARAYMLRYRKNCTPGFTLADLQEVKRATDAWHAKFTQVVLPSMKAGGNTIKLHKFLAHFKHSVVRLGHPYHYHANPYEALHTLVKIIARAGNFRPDEEGQTIESMVNAERRLELAVGLEMPLGYVKRDKAYQTAHKTAQSLGMDVMVSAGKQYDLTTNPGAQGTYRSELAKLLPAYAAKNNMHINNFIKEHRTAVVCSVLPWVNELSVLQEIRAAENFYNKPWFDCVQYQYKAGPRSRVTQQHGIVRCLFTVNLRGTKEPSQDDAEQYREFKQKTQLMLVQCLEKRDSSCVLARLGCTPMKLEGWTNNTVPSQYNARYRIVPLCDVIRRVYLIQDYKHSHNAHFFINPFKWDRTLKDGRSLAEKEGPRYMNGVIKNA